MLIIRIIWDIIKLASKFLKKRENKNKTKLSHKDKNSIISKSNNTERRNLNAHFTSSIHNKSWSIPRNSEGDIIQISQSGSTLPQIHRFNLQSIF